MPGPASCAVRREHGGPYGQSYDAHRPLIVWDGAE